MKLPNEMVELAEHILDTKAGHFDPAEFEDRYENAVVEMLKQKQAGMPVKKEAPIAAPSTVVNLMDALRRSIQAEQRPAAAKKAKAPAEKICRQAGRRKVG
jgi:DNA end-binding protein Ku